MIIAILNIIIISLMILTILYFFVQNHNENSHMGLNMVNNARENAYLIYKDTVYRKLCFLKF